MRATQPHPITCRMRLAKAHSVLSSSQCTAVAVQSAFGASHPCASSCPRSDGKPLLGETPCSSHPSQQDEHQRLCEEGCALATGCVPLESPTRGAIKYMHVKSAGRDWICPWLAGQRGCWQELQSPCTGMQRFQVDGTCQSASMLQHVRTARNCCQGMTATPKRNAPKVGWQATRMNPEAHIQADPQHT